MTEAEKDKLINQVLRIVPIRIRNLLGEVLRCNLKTVHEFVFRTERPVCVYKNGEQWYLTENGCLTNVLDSQNLITISCQEMTECFNYACGFSVYSHINEIRDGFVTISGGHRVGISGTAVMSGGEITNIRDISGISVRISREVHGCGRELARILSQLNKGLLICGSPCSGKTTVLRDIARILSTDYSSRTCVIDTKSELASAYKGVIQKDLGMCDVFDLYPRSTGIIQAVRLLSPRYIICDEIGSSDDTDALISGVNSGVIFVASIHAGSADELKNRCYFKEIMSTGAFGKIVFLSGRENPGQVVSFVESEMFVS